MLALVGGEAVEERVTLQRRGIGIDGTLHQNDQSATKGLVVDDGGDRPRGVVEIVIVGDEDDRVGKVAAGQGEVALAGTMVETELQRAPERVRRLFSETFDPADLLPLTDEADELAARYMEQKVVPAKYEDDARHVAIAVTHAIPYIVSWNFKHLVNVRREVGFNAVNVLHGYPSVRIVSPLEL